MIKRLKSGAGLVAGLAALALGGSAIAGAASSSTPTKASAPSAHEVTTAPDTDNVRSGDQTTRDTTRASANEVTTGRDIGNVQSGDQTTPDKAGTSQADTSTSETSSETGGESAANNDGPGGHADPAGNPNTDTQQQGQN